ncbi:MFS transporter [Streptomyces sp. NPDC003077]|uniref:MFS transporter n=1 Tax=Streptomyces sp. NPDC003077 TaxID=3154443 RepID=UPI0033B671DF
MPTSPGESVAERALPAPGEKTQKAEMAEKTGKSAETARGARPRPGLGFAVLAVVQCTLIFTITLISVPLPIIGREFGLGSADLVLVSAAYGLPYSGLLLFGGRLTDRYVGRRMFVVGLAVFGLASAAAAFAPSFWALVGLRFTQGIGAAMTAPAAVAVLRALLPEPAAFGRAMATWGGVSVLGATLGPIVSGVVTTWVSWRWMFAVPVVVSFLALAVTKPLMPEGPAAPAEGRPGLDPAGAVLATLGISIGSYGLIVSGDHPWTATTVFVPLVVGAVLLGAFLLVERRVRHPLLPPGFARQPRRVVGLVGILLAAAASGLVNFLLSLYLQQERGWSPLATAGAFVPFTIALIATNKVAAPLVGRWGAGKVTITGLAVGAVGFALLAGIKSDSTYSLGLLPGLILLPIGASFIFSGSAVLATAHVPQHQVGLAGGVMNTAMELGPTVGLAALMSVAATQTDVVVGYAWAFGAAAVAYLVAAVVSVGLIRRGGPVPEDGAEAGAKVAEPVGG